MPAGPFTLHLAPRAVDSARRYNLLVACVTMTGSTAPDERGSAIPDTSYAADPVVAELAGRIAGLKRLDPLAPVSVVVPSHTAGICLAHELARLHRVPAPPESAVCATGREPVGEAGTPSPAAGLANVRFVVVADIVRMLGREALADEGLGLADTMAVTEATRLAAEERTGPLGILASTDRGLALLCSALDELRDCDRSYIEGLSAATSGEPVGADLAGILDSTRQRLHEAGMADRRDLEEAALRALEAFADTDREAAGARPDPPDRGDRTIGQLGHLIVHGTGELNRRQTQILERLLGSHTAHRVPEPPRRLAVDHLVSCSDPDEEVRAAVRIILASLETGVPLWRQALLHPGGERYARIAHQQLDAAGIPWSGPSLVTLGRTPAARVLLGALDLAAGNWARADVIRWFASGPIYLKKPGGSLVPVAEWTALSARAGIVGGAEEWTRRLADPLPGNGRGAQHSGTSPNALSAFMSELFELARPPCSEVSDESVAWEKWCDWARTLLERYVPEVSEETEGSSGDSVLEEIHDLLDELAMLERISRGCSLATFTSRLRDGLASGTATSPRHAYGTGVFVAPFYAADSMRFDVVVVAGMSDSNVPGAMPENPLLGEQLRKDPRCDLLTREERLERRQAALQRALGSCTGKCWATWPRSDPARGAPMVPSRWLDMGGDYPTRRWVIPSFQASVICSPWEPAELEQGASSQYADGEENSDQKAGGQIAALAHPESDAMAGLRELAVAALSGSDMKRTRLVKTNTTLTSSLEALTSRNDQKFTSFDGLVGGDAGSCIGSDIPISPTRLETYAACPRRFLFERVLMVEDLAQPEAVWEMDPMERGSMVHAILAEYVGELIGGSPRSIERLTEIALEHFSDAESSGMVGATKLWELERYRISRDLKRFFAEDVLDPLAVEMDFGRPPGQASESDPTAEASLAGGCPAVEIELGTGKTVKFSGTIDRVDRARDGTIVVSDYKTGRQSDLANLLQDPVDRGRRLQLPLYAKAAADRFGQDSPVRARYWLLSSQRSAPCYELPLTEVVEERFTEAVRVIVDAIGSGLFPGIPGEERNEGFANCSYCAFNRICPSDRLEAWERLGSDEVLDSLRSLIEDPPPPDLAQVVTKGSIVPEEEP